MLLKVLKLLSLHQSSYFCLHFFSPHFFISMKWYGHDLNATKKNAECRDVLVSDFSACYRLIQNSNETTRDDDNSN